jgi:MoaA/NifB/PqqE/SkfB family radical SAM enzyme
MKPLVQNIVVKLMGIHIFIIVLFHFRSWKTTTMVVGKLQSKIRQYRGPASIRRLAHVDGGFYWDMYAERWPSRGFVRSVKREANRAKLGPAAHVGLRTILLAVTTKCALRCEHCFEWDNLNLKERLTFADLDKIIADLISYGATQIHFGGGEPMMRYDDVVRLIGKYSHKTSFWIVTSGFQVTKERAVRLKSAGLAGLCVSIDHHDARRHDEFRHFPNAFGMATSAVKFANEAGLVTALSLCATREYLSHENLLAYMLMARSIKVSFVQLLEPRAVGHYEGKPVQLNDLEKKILEDVFISINNEPRYDDYPVVIYHEYYKNTLGCRGAGAGALYIDPLGNVHACPFCRSAVGNLVTDPVEACIDRLRATGCHVAPLPAVRKTSVAEPAYSDL